MEIKTITVEVMKKDKSGFKATDGEWYSNKFKTFELKKGDTAEIKLNDKGFLESVEVKVSAPITVGQEMQQERISAAIKQKQASVMISYAKDLAVAQLIKPEEISKWASSFMALQEELVAGTIPSTTEERSSDNQDIKLDDDGVYN